MDEAPPQGRFAALILVVTGWPRLFIAVAIAAVVLAATLALGVPLFRSLLVAWDAGTIFFLAAAVLLAIRADTFEIRRRAARQDVGEVVILTLTALAALASVGAIYAELGAGRGSQVFAVALAAVTFILSWLFVHVFFSFHYAHEFYGRGEADRLPGVIFPDGLTDPDYWDFLYFSLVIGMTSQVSDVTVSSRRIRKIVMAHGLVAFLFNVTLLALVVNIAADAIKPA